MAQISNKKEGNIEREKQKGREENHENINIRLKNGIMEKWNKQKD